jgi:hypothetical protein
MAGKLHRMGRNGPSGLPAQSILWTTQGYIETFCNKFVIQVFPPLAKAPASINLLVIASDVALHR